MYVIETIRARPVGVLLGGTGQVRLLLMRGPQRAILTTPAALPQGRGAKEETQRSVCHPRTGVTSHAA